MQRQGIVVIVCAALAASAYCLLPGKQQANDGPAGGSGATELPRPAAAESAAAAPQAAAPAKVDHSRELELPDGTFVAALNGAVDVPPLQQFWGAVPWSPIIGVERSDKGLDWYRHADGSYSTTQMVWREDLGREVAMTRVGRPGPAVTPPVAK